MPLGESETIQMVDATVIAPGSDFGPRYRIEALLGQGGMGRVYKAYDKDLDRTVAIKVVREGAIGQADALKRFKQELVLASKISHKNILRIHDMGDVAGLRFISMAYVEGQDLQHIIRDNPGMPMERILKFAQQIAEALAAAHAEGVVHRDLKPQNLLVDKNDQIYVCDFGLAKSFEEGAIGMTRTGAFLGTPRYMSPEQVEGKPADGRADLYAYGLILYELVVGDVPFTGESTLKVMYQRIQEKPKSPKLIKPDLPNWLVRIIMRCLERNPDDRYQNAYEILADLQGSMTGSGVSRSGISRIGSGSQSVIIQIPEFANRRWVWVVAAIVFVIGLAFAISPIRHMIPGFRPGPGTEVGSSGIPTLAQGKFVAVLPFRVLGDDQSLSYVAEGLNEALSSKLFQIKTLRLAPETAVAKFSDKDPITKIAHGLGSNLIVEGILQGDASRMAIIVNLLDASDNGKKIWSQQFTGTSKDVLSIEDQISSQLVTALDVKMTNEELASTNARPTDNADAYDLYLRGRQAYRGSDRDKAIATSIDFYQQALAKDPGFALAYTGLADASLETYNVKKDSFWAQKALGAAQRAEQLKDTLPEVHFSLGSIYQATGKSDQAISELKRGLELAPNSEAGYVRLGSAYLAAGKKDEAIAAFKKAIDVNPYNWALHSALGRAYVSIGDNQKALDEYKNVTQLEPESADGWNNVASTYERLNQIPDAISAYQKSIQLHPDWLTYANLCYLYTMQKQYPEAIAAGQKGVELGPNQELAAGNLADAYRYSGGPKDKADEMYDKAIALAFKDLQVNPQNTEPMGDLATYYAKKGDTKRATEFIQRARTIDSKDLELMHIQATVENLSNRPADALKTLREALAHGYSAKDVAEDPEFKNLQDRPEFKAMIKEFGKNEN
jgi:tetratricopeptide (TPR) repeat protein/TolB-like protein/tRNA A-37 threonylcarbamoyl transferase component Bud32